LLGTCSAARAEFDELAFPCWGGLAARAKRPRALAAAVPLVEAQTIEQVMASRTRAHKTPSSPLSPEEERALIHPGIDRYYRDLLDETVPMLGNMTPRRAAKTMKGREKLVAWLKYMENQAANQQAGPQWPITISVGFGTNLALPICAAATASRSPVPR
jgi:hypothetical protein